MSEKYASWVTLRPQWDRYRQGEAEVRLLNFKTTWSEFQKTSQTAPEQGEAELCILYFKTTLSEFQKPSQTATERGEAELRILDFKNIWSDYQNTTTAEGSEAELCLYNLKETSAPQSRSQAVVCVSTPRMYPRSRYFLVIF